MYVSQPSSGKQSAYQIQRSLRLRKSATAYFSRTFITPTDNRKFTLSARIKRGQLGSAQSILGTTDNNLASGNLDRIQFAATDQIEYLSYQTGYSLRLLTNQVFRDPAAHYHIVLLVDTTQATASNRARLFVNGTEITSFSVATYPTLNYAPYFNSATAHYVGAYNTSGVGIGATLDGYISELNFIDGQGLTPASFGQFDSVTGAWTAKKYAGSHGINGCYLDFKDVTNLTTLFQDRSGNGNNWTGTNVSLTAGVTYDSMLDVPLSYGTTDRGNYCVFNPLDRHGSLGMANGNLRVTQNSNLAGVAALSTSSMNVGDKWYWEVTRVAWNVIEISGFAPTGTSRGAAYTATDTVNFRQNAIYKSNVAVQTGLTGLNDGDVVGVALDLVANSVQFYRNGVAWGTAVTVTQREYTVAHGSDTSGFTANCTTDYNFGQRPYSYTPPVGFKSLHTWNLPVPGSVALNPKRNFALVPYTGGGYKPVVVPGTNPYTNPAANATPLIQRSLRFRASALAYVSRTFVTPTDGKKWTLNLWVKRGLLGTDQEIFSHGLNANEGQIFFKTDNRLRLYEQGATAGDLTTVRVFQDTSSHGMLTIACDTTLATAADRVKVYWNSEVCALTGTAWSLNGVGYNTAIIHTIGRYAVSASNPFDGYISEVYFVDGKALTPAAFGEYDSVNTTFWEPKLVATVRAAIAVGGGARNGFGANGFYMPFSDTTSTTTLMYDRSQSDVDTAGNNGTANNLSLTAGVNYDSMTDVPGASWDDGGLGRGSYCTLSPLSCPANITLSNANLQATSTGGAINNVRSTAPTTSQFSYWEVTATTVSSSLRLEIGGILSSNVEAVANTAYLASTAPSGTFAANWGTVASTLNFYVNGSSVFSVSSVDLVANDVVMFAHDSTAGKIWVGRNGTWFNSGSPAAGTGQVATLSAGAVFPAVMLNGSAGTNAAALNFGQRPFAYTPPVGFKALHTGNLPLVSSTAMNVGLAIIKDRSVANKWAFTDSVRGAGMQLASSDTAAETATLLSTGQFFKGGLYVGSDVTTGTVNDAYMAVMFGVSGPPVINTNGSITSQVSANAAAGFSAVTYIGTGANATVGHGLSVAPKMVIVKRRDNGSGATNWRVYHSGLNGGINPAQYNILLNSTAAQTGLTAAWNDTAPTSSTFTVGTSVETNSNGGAYVAYCFAEIDGYSKIGSYAGDGGSDGRFIFCGFRPAYLLVKCYDGVANWIVLDNTRNIANVVDLALFPDSTSAESGGGTYMVDFNSNGFKLRTANGLVNGVNNYIFMAFAEAPFKYSLAR